jgi:hypothetical protein
MYKTSHLQRRPRVKKVYKLLPGAKIQKKYDQEKNYYFNTFYELIKNTLIYMKQSGSEKIMRLNVSLSYYYPNVKYSLIYRHLF